MDSRPDITTFAIEPEEILAEIDDLNIHEATSQSPAVFFSGIH